MCLFVYLFCYEVVQLVSCLSLDEVKKVLPSLLLRMKIITITPSEQA